MADELIPCPGGCGNRLYPRAQECPKCGYHGDISGVGDLLGSLSTTCSILVGFGLAALVTLVTDESRAMEDTSVSIAAGLWLFASIAQLFVLIAAEVLRRQEHGADIGAEVRADSGVWKRCGVLLNLFALALVFMAAGVVLVGFHFSTAHGLVGVGSVLVGSWYTVRALR